MTARLFTARWLVRSPEERIDPGGLVVSHGLIREVVCGPSAVRRARARAGARATDLGDVVLAPGFVNAHAHLELSGLCGQLSGKGSFTAWIEALIAARRARGDAAIARDVRAGADRLLSTGTTAVGDIDSIGLVSSALTAYPLRVRLYREALDAGDPSRAKTALERATRRLPRRARTYAGLAPHAPYTVSAELFAALSARARAGRLPVAIHWAETREEVEWLEHGRGALSRILSRSPRTSGLEAIDRAGLLGPRTALVHGNHPDPRDVERIARSGAALVHCPGTHAFFGREPFDERPWLAAGVPLALGTDSLASNEDLDMRREMALFRQAHPAVAPARVWDMATRGAAGALGLAPRAGRISPGAWADLVAHRVDARAPAAILEALAQGASKIAGVWIAGRAVPPQGST